MKTLRFIGMALLTVLMSVAISSCSKSDDDNNGGGGSSASIEGTWIEKRLISYEWDYSKNSPDMSTGKARTPNDPETWIISKNGDNLKVKQYFFESGSLLEDEFILTHVKDNEYKIGDDRFIFSNITETSMQIDIYIDYYDDTSTNKEYKIWRFEKIIKE